MVAFGEQVQVEFAKNGTETVRIVDLDGLAVIDDAQAIVPWESVGHLAAEESGTMQSIQCEDVATLGLDHGHRCRTRQKGAHGRAIAAVMQTEDRERVAVLAARDRAQSPLGSGPNRFRLFPQEKS